MKSLSAPGSADEKLTAWGSTPHPFIALLDPLKGKRFIGRLGRDLTDNQKVMALSVIVTLIEQVDVIRNAAALDSVEDSRDRRFVERQAYAFQEHVVNQGLQLSPASRTLRIYNNLIEIMLENGPTFSRIMRTRVSPIDLLLGGLVADACSLDSHCWNTSLPRRLCSSMDYRVLTAR